MSTNPSAALREKDRPVVLVLAADRRGPVDVGRAAAQAGYWVLETRWCEIVAADRLTVLAGSRVDQAGARSALPVIALVPDLVVALPGAVPRGQHAVQMFARACPQAWLALPGDEESPDGDGSSPIPPGEGTVWLAAMPGRRLADVLAVSGGIVNVTEAVAAFAKRLPPAGDAQVRLAALDGIGSARRWTTGTAALRSADVAGAFFRLAAGAITAFPAAELAIPVLGTDEPAPHAVHPLAALLPMLGPETGLVLTEPLASAKFSHVDERLTTTAGVPDRMDALADLLIRTTTRDRDPAPQRHARFAEPGVGRTVLVDGLAVTGRPELVDFSATGAGLTPYSWDGFVDLGTPLTGRTALARADHRRRCGERLEAAGCTIAPVLAIVEIADEDVAMPDGSRCSAAIVVRGFRCVLRVKQLDPVASLYHSVQHAPLLADAIHEAAGLGTADEPDAVVAALDDFGAAYDDVRRLLGAGPQPEPWASARAMRLRLVYRYAPVLIELACRRLARLRDADRDVIGTADYVDHFATVLGDNMGRFRQLRFLHDYHRAPAGHPQPVNTLVENNVTLLGEVPDLDTGVFVDDDPEQLAIEIRADREQLRKLRAEYGSLHDREVAAARAITRTLAAAAVPAEEDAVRAAQASFDRAYRAALR